VQEIKLNSTSVTLPPQAQGDYVACKAVTLSFDRNWRNKEEGRGLVMMSAFSYIEF